MIPLPNRIHCRTHSVFAQKQKNVNRQPESSSKNPKFCQPIRIELEKLLNFVSHSESSITSPELSANQNRVLRHSEALNYGGGAFAVLSSIRRSITYLDT